MSDRYYNYNKGSRSTRDDSRPPRDKYGETSDRDKQRSRSRSPRRRSSPSRSRGSEEKSKSRERECYEDKKNVRSSWSDEEEVPAPPPPPRISKISIGFSKQKAPIKMSLVGPAKQLAAAPKPTVASVFNSEDDDEPEEMPAEAKMRMRNIGRETPTSAGPNSFGKTKQGFCDAKKVFEKNLKQALETQGTDKSGAPKFPQTIYKIKGP